MAYAPIESYGLIGNMRTAALVGPDGSIDWLCLPHFDSPSVFGAILDDRKGGRFSIRAEAPGALCSRYYQPDTNVLIARWLTHDGVGEVIDFMPVAVAQHERRRPSLVRFVRVDHGRMRFSLRCEPAFNYARDPHRPSITEEGVEFRTERERLLVSSTVPLRVHEAGAYGDFTLGAGEAAAFAVQYGERLQIGRDGVSVPEARDLLADTISYWERWVSQCTYQGRWREMVMRSALVLKLLTFEPTGAIVAAPTCSLPEHIGGSRNWDYRYTWLRDAAFTVYALLRIGFTAEAAAFMQWLQDRSHELEPDGMLRPVYGIDGRHDLPEEELTHLEGYMGSRPVRIGNGAADQLQLDVCGGLMDAAYLHNKHASPLSYDLWVELRKLLGWVVRNWQRPDQGIWEMRGPPRHFVYSKLMCWVALDRGVRLAEARSFPGDVELWRRTRDEIYEQIMRDGWSRTRGAFVQHYGGDALDAANLIMPLVFFISPNDPRMESTIRALNRPLYEGGLVTDYLVHRYDTSLADDGLGFQPEGPFNICTFWLIEALTRAGRMNPEAVAQARLLFDRMLRCASPLGLYAEQTAPGGMALGNHPQGLTHLAFISAAFNLNRALSGGA